jgi:aryl-alcohol dehydrogenase-like predicted oxidoreductase
MIGTILSGGRYSLIGRRIEVEILPVAEREGIGMIVYSPMASGLLSGAMTRERIAALPVDDWRRRSEEFGVAKCLLPSPAEGTLRQVSRHLSGARWRPD